MSCGVSMERYGRGGQENLVLKNFLLKNIFLTHPKTQKNKKIQNMSCGVSLYKDMVQESSFKYILHFFLYLLH